MVRTPVIKSCQGLRDSCALLGRDAIVLSELSHCRRVSLLPHSPREHPKFILVPQQPVHVGCPPSPPSPAEAGSRRGVGAARGLHGSGGAAAATASSLAPRLLSACISADFPSPLLFFLIDFKSLWCPPPPEPARGGPANGLPAVGGVLRAAVCVPASPGRAVPSAAGRPGPPASGLPRGVALPFSVAGEGGGFLPLGLVGVFWLVVLFFFQVGLGGDRRGSPGTECHPEGKMKDTKMNACLLPSAAPTLPRARRHRGRHHRGAAAPAAARISCPGVLIIWLWRKKKKGGVGGVEGEKIRMQKKRARTR